ncbi:hypothetical protein BGX38DRAFT_1278127 [Terfezia claveryi]|nr:hypothetical protein BGX38DRAFT_1278127 [Terfezia claveryi]
MAEGAKRQKRNRSITQFTGLLRDMTETAVNRLETITLFEEPFPDPQRAEDILAKAWREAETYHLHDHSRDNKIDSYVRHSIVFVARWTLRVGEEEHALLYQFDRNTLKEYIRDHVGRLLKRDRLRALRVFARLVVIDFAYKKESTSSISTISMPEETREYRLKLHKADKWSLHVFHLHSLIPCPQRLGKWGM